MKQESDGEEANDEFDQGSSPLSLMRTNARAWCENNLFSI